MKVGDGEFGEGIGIAGGVGGGDEDGVGDVFGKISEAVFPVAIGFKDSNGLTTAEGELDVGVGLDLAGNEWVRGGNDELTLVPRRNSCGVVGGPVHGIFIDRFEDNVRDGGVDGEGPSLRGGGIAFTTDGDYLPGMRTFRDGCLEGQVDVTAVDAGGIDRSGLYVRVGDAVGDDDVVAVDGVVVDAGIAG